jgi:hypothetical protein
MFPYGLRLPTCIVSFASSEGDTSPILLPAGIIGAAWRIFLQNGSAPCRFLFLLRERVSHTKMIAHYRLLNDIEK